MWGKLLPASVLEHGPSMIAELVNTLHHHRKMPGLGDNIRSVNHSQSNLPNHGWARAGLARWVTVPRLQALKMTKGSRTCFSDSGMFPQAHKLFAVQAGHLQPLLAHREQKQRARAAAARHVGLSDPHLHTLSQAAGFKDRLRAGAGDTAPGLLVQQQVPLRSLG